MANRKSMFFCPLFVPESSGHQMIQPEALREYKDDVFRSYVARDADFQIHTVRAEKSNKFVVKILAVMFDSPARKFQFIALIISSDARAITQDLFLHVEFPDERDNRFSFTISETLSEIHFK